MPVGRRFVLKAGISAPTQFPDFDQVVGTFGLPHARPERARALDVTFETRPTSSTRWQAVFYDRRERNVLRLEDSETRLLDGRVVSSSSLAPTWKNALDGRARGVELIVQRRVASGVSGWVGYSYGRARYSDTLTGETFWADFDQRHSLNAYVEDRLSARTSVSMKLRLGSGFPLPGYFAERPDGLFAGAGRNTVRLPTYARLDLRADRAFNYRRSRLTLFAEVVNVFNRTNYAPDYGSFFSTGRAFNFTAKQFPILPSVGILLEF
jgi:outer membrane cobalamin receptor